MKIDRSHSAITSTRLLQFHFILFVVLLLFSTLTAASEIVSDNAEISESISVPGENDSYTFTANAGETVIIRAGDPNNTYISPGLSLYDPNGILVSSDWGYLVASLTHQVTESGTYTLLVYDESDGTGDYDLYFVRVPGANEGGVLPNGGSISDRIDMGDLDSYTFTANAGETVVIRAGDPNNTSISPGLSLYDPNGILVSSGWGYLVASLTHQVIASGTYTVLVYDGANVPDGTGDYDLYFVRVPGANEGGVLPNGGSISDRIDMGDLDSYTFTANAGETVVIRAGDPNNTSISPGLSLYDPNGILVSSGWGYLVASLTHQVIASGTYTVLVYDGANVPDGTGDYDLYFVRVPGANEGGVLPNGGSISDRIDMGDLDSYTFTANAGETVVIRAGDPNNTSISPGLSLYDPNGILVSSGWGYLVASLTHQVIASGTYTVLVYDGANVPDGTGDYDLYFVRVPGANEGGVQNGEGVIENSIDRGDIDSYTFLVSSGESIDIEISDLANSSLSPGISLYNPSGTFISSDWGYADASLSRLATQSGIYTLLVYDGASVPDGAGNYSLYLNHSIRPATLFLSNDQPYWDTRDPAGPVVLFRWTAESNATHYEVYRDGIKIYPTDGEAYNGFSFRNELGLIAGQSYSFYVLAKSSTASWQSNTINVGPMPSEPATPVLNSGSPNTILQGNSFQDITLSGSNFTASSWHQFSTDNGVTWNPAQSFPTINDTTSMTVGVNNTVVRTVLVRVCASYGSILCSSSAAVTIQVNQDEIVPQVTKVIPNIIEQGNGTQNVTLTGNAFTSANRYQQSTDGGNTWIWAASVPTVSDSKSMLVAIDNTVIGTVHVRVCASQGSSLCSKSKAVQIHASPFATPSVDSVSPDSIPIGASYQNVRILGNDFSATSWHQLSTNGGSTWGWAQTAPIINSSELVTIAINDKEAGTVDIRMCASYGSGDCSSSVALTILPENPPDELVINCPPLGCATANTKAVVITHGWGATAFDWVYDMASDVCERVGTPLMYTDYQVNTTMQVCSSGEWDVWIVDWTALAIAGVFPQTTQLNAASEGIKVATYFLNTHNYEHFHFIGHSAGSQLIDSATKILAPIATIHETFLDAYDSRAILPSVFANVTRHVSNYGEKADWVDNYVDTRTLCDGDGLVDGSPLDLLCRVFDATDLHLTYGFNVDVTPDFDDCENLLSYDEVKCRHGRPYRFYGKSINNAITDTYKGRDPVYDTGSWGFRRSMEDDGNMRVLEYGKNQECLMQPDGKCNYVPWTRYIWTYLPRSAWDSVVDGVTGTVNFVKGTAGKLFDSARFITNWIFPGSNSLSRAQDGAEISADEAAYMLAQVTTVEPVNVMRFDWAFDSAGEGVLQVFVNGDLVYLLDQRFSPQASVETEEVYIGGINGTLPPGTHDIAFRLDGYGVNPSDIMLTNVELALKQAIDPDAHMVTPSVGIGGSVNPDYAQSVSLGATMSFIVTANQGFTLNSTVGGTCPAGSWTSNTWTTGPIDADCTVSFSFAKQDEMFKDGFEGK